MLIRHGLPLRHAAAAAADPGLAADGHAQAALLAQYLDPEGVAAVYSSPMRRAVETAQPLVTLLGLSVTVVDDLAELDRHADEYVPIEELRAAGDPRWDAISSGLWIGDEDPDVFRRRVVDAIEGIVTRHPGQVVAVVCHGGVIGAYLTHLLGRESVFPFCATDYTSIHRVAAARTGPRAIISLNETAHLRGTGLPVGLFRRTAAVSPTNSGPG